MSRIEEFNGGISFTIEDIKIEKRINGNTIISAKCNEDDTALKIIVPSKDRSDRMLVRQKLLNQYRDIKPYPKVTEIELQKGDIL
jgi:hypothetical protein